MPPKIKYTRENIINAAIELIRDEGGEMLSVRNLAKRLGCSTAPIFTSFDNTAALLEAVGERVTEIYKEYLDAGLGEPIPFKGAGMSYVRFAKEEPRLFRFIFMRPGSSHEASHYLPSEFKFEQNVRAAARDGYGLPDAEAARIYNHLSVYVHGLACLYAEGQCYFTLEDTSRMISEMFFALRSKNDGQGN
jgi:AcrR family transcriptional regulator